MSGISKKVFLESKSATTLTQISGYITHKNLAVRKIMEAMRTVYAKNGTQSQHVSNKTWGKLSWNVRESCERKACIVCKGLIRFEVQHSFLYFFSLVRISEFLYTNFSSTCVQCTRLLKS